MYRWGLGIAALCVAVGCGGGGTPEDAGSGGDAAPAECTAAADCDDGLFCNGAERCGDDGVCAAGTAPCTASACDEALNACDGDCVDEDGDGSLAIACGGDDCDDADPTRFPGNVETCDARGHDEDCDPSTLGGSDADSDGFESAACCNAQPDGALLCGTDCDDGTGSVHPGVTDDCNLTDDDCDGAIDEDPATLFYRDLDGDGFGRPDDPDAPADERAVRACGGGPGFSPLDTDCDDDARTINPAAAEVCADGIDNNCDMVQDADPSRPSFTCACTTVGEERACGGGTENASPATCRPGTQTCQVGGTWSACLGEIPPRTETCDGADDDCDGTVDEGVQIQCYGDPDGDGFAEAGVSPRDVCPAPAREDVGDCPVFFTDLAPTDAASTDCDPGDRSVRPGAFDRCNGIDDDCDGATDEGASDAGCTDANGWGRCVAGSCRVVACAFGRGDCDGLSSTGCETDVLGTDAHCGACGLRCELGARCVDGTCQDGWRDLATARDHVCGVGADGSVWCWGEQGGGRLGEGGGTAGLRTPVRVTLPGPAIAVGAEELTSCAALEDGRVRCWGANDFGVAGQPTTGLYPPTEVPTVTGAVDVGVGDGRACARTGGGAVLCWGRGIPMGTVMDMGLTGVTAMEVGYDHACAVDGTGQAWCWGLDAFGQLGNGAGGETLSMVSGLDDAVAIAAGRYQSCAIRASEEVWCWGRNEALHELGLPTLGNQDVPVRIDGVSGAAAISAGGGAICARDAMDAVTCWGSQIFAEGRSRTPQPLTSLGRPRAIEVGVFYVCVIDARGAVGCMGDLDQGRGGDGIDASYAARPRPVARPAGPAEVRLAEDALGGQDQIAVRARDGSVDLDGLEAGMLGAVSIDLARDHGCAARADGSVACWGNGFGGELGHGVEESRSDPVEVTGITDAWRVAVGPDHSCALHRDGSVSCWGANGSMQLGAASPARSSVPVAVPGVTGAVAISAGFDFTCVRRSTGDAWCWGLDDRGQLGRGSGAGAGAPAPVADLTDVTALSAGAEHACATLATGETRCWGSNGSEALGNETSGDSSTPISVPGVLGAVGLGAGDAHQCALDAAGRVTCWGNNGSRQCGVDAAGTGSATPPVLVTGIFGARQTDGGTNNQCAVRDRAVLCWGEGIGPSPATRWP